MGYWDPFFALWVFDDFDELADSIVKSRQGKTLERVSSKAKLRQPGDTFREEVWAYRPKDLKVVLGEVRTTLERVDLEAQSLSPTLIDSFVTLMTLLHRAFEPLTPAGRRGAPWTILTLSR